MRVETWLGARTDCDNAETHCGGVLHREMAEAASRAGEDDPVTDLGVRVLDRAVYGDTSAEDGGSLRRGELVGDGRHVGDPRDDVLRKGSVDGEAAVFAVEAA